MLNFNNHQPHHEADFFEDETPETNQIRFYKATGNLSEFGLYFSGGLALALLSRLIPGMLITYGLLLGIAAGYIAIAIRGDRREGAVIGLAIAFSTIAGFWDALVNLIAMVNPLIWIGIMLGAFAVGLSVFMGRGR
ncbi:hypothetical protein NDI44_08625 [Trichocoleus sp. DQ-A3]|uniref:hypothetical protein n=1 Tax=Cyanophyceae TaxID=3028117 RepID=UPI0016872445|nr:hypothetical protein [Coleofasciculus sp. FACHB-125]MBD1899255.1 hypothetical protein [Coleofasciculus sp. FACHB-125]